LSKSGTFFGSIIWLLVSVVYAGAYRAWRESPRAFAGTATRANDKAAMPAKAERNIIRLSISPPFPKGSAPDNTQFYG
jgi:hypothetical protein